MKTLVLSVLSVFAVASAQACPEAAKAVVENLFKVNDSFYFGPRPAVVPGPITSTYRVIKTERRQFETLVVYRFEVGNIRSRGGYEVVASVQQNLCKVNSVRDLELHYTSN